MLWLVSATDDRQPDPGVTTSFEEDWMRIQQSAGQVLHRKTGLPFTYPADATHVVPDRTSYPLHVSQFRLAYDKMPLSGPGEINRLVGGPAYVFATSPTLGSAPHFDVA
jgi:hypothetical protein